MEFSSLAINIIILSIPGIISNRLYNTLIGKKNKKDWEEFFEVIFISIICYLTISFIQSFDLDMRPLTISYEFKLVDNLVAISSGEMNYNFLEVALASLVGIVISIIYSYFYTYNLLNRFGMCIKATFRYGSEDLWEKFQKDYGDNWITVRDLKTRFYYFGHIVTYSDSDKRRELIMKDASVYTEDGDFCYEVNKVYLSREFDDLIIEFFSREVMESEEQNEEE